MKLNSILAWFGLANALAVASAFGQTSGGPVLSERVLRDRLKGMIVGSILGDAAGGPVEFQPLDQVMAAFPQYKRWEPDEAFDAEGIRERAAVFALDSYGPLRPVPEPYAHWTSMAAPGTATDDTRHKIFVMNALRSAKAEDRWPPTALDVAQAYVAYPVSEFIQSRVDYVSLAGESLAEYGLAARWVLGERDPSKARPVSRLWGGLPTNAGQMALFPLAGLSPGEPTSAYRLAYDLGFMDVGTAKDMNACLVAGLAACLGRSDTSVLSPDTLDDFLFEAPLSADPLGYEEIPWTQRRIAYWLNVAKAAADEAEGKPAVLFEILNERLADDIKWEAHVPVVVAFSVMRLCRYDTLASLQTCLEFGHDTDSYAQVIGAFLGAVYGVSTFPEPMVSLVSERFLLDYGEDVDEWVDFLMDLGSADSQ